ncbi:MAG: hypothetical protein ACE366_30010 [Bradymonadia bacterium]
MALSEGVWSCTPNGLAIEQMGWLVEHIVLRLEALDGVTWVGEGTLDPELVARHEQWLAQPPSARVITNAPPQVLVAALMGEVEG